MTRERERFLAVFSGTRDLSTREALEHARREVFRLRDDAIVLHGGSGAIDRAVDTYARERGLIVGVFDANWDVHGKPGDHITEAMIALLPNRVVIIWDEKSPGSRRALEYARRYGIDQVIEHVVKR